VVYQGKHFQTTSLKFDVYFPLNAEWNERTLRLIRCARTYFIWRPVRRDLLNDRMKAV